MIWKDWEKFSVLLGSGLPKVPCDESFSSFFLMHDKMKFYQKDKSFMKSWTTFAGS